MRTCWDLVHLSCQGVMLENDGSRDQQGHVTREGGQHTCEKVAMWGSIPTKRRGGSEWAWAHVHDFWGERSFRARARASRRPWRPRNLRIPRQKIARWRWSPGCVHVCPFITRYWWDPHPLYTILGYRRNTLETSGPRCSSSITIGAFNG